jgi:hypothetical protein
LAREGGLGEEEADALEALADIAIMPCRDDHHFTRKKTIYPFSDGSKAE